MPDCLERVAIETHFRSPGTDLSDDLLGHLATCPDCAGAVTSLLDSRVGHAGAVIQTRGETGKAAPAISPRATELYEQAEEMMERELGSD